MAGKKTFNFTSSKAAPVAKNAKSNSRHMQADDDAVLPPQLPTVDDVLGEDIDLSRSNNISEQLETTKDHFLKTMTGQRANAEKFKTLQHLNQKLAENNNWYMQIIIDVNKLLNGYIEFLDVIKNQTSQMEQDLDKMGPNDFDYVKNLTTEKIFSLAEEFKKSAADLKTLYSHYGMDQEYGKIELAEKQMDSVVTEADSAWSKLSMDGPAAAAFARNTGDKKPAGNAPSIFAASPAASNAKAGNAIKQASEAVKTANAVVNSGKTATNSAKPVNARGNAAKNATANAAKPVPAANATNATKPINTAPANAFAPNAAKPKAWQGPGQDGIRPLKYGKLPAVDAAYKQNSQI